MSMGFGVAEAKVRATDGYLLTVVWTSCCMRMKGMLETLLRGCFYHEAPYVLTPFCVPPKAKPTTGPSGNWRDNLRSPLPPPSCRYTEVEVLNGQNQYKTDDYGMQVGMA